MQTIDNFNFAGKKAFVRVDFNVPVDENFQITDDNRIRAALPTLKKILSDGGSLIIAAAGMAAHLPGVIASMTTVPVIGVPINASLDGLDALLAIVQMPPGIPVATVGINGALNAALLAVQIMATADVELQKKLVAYKVNLKKKIVEANEELKKVSYRFKTN